MLGSATPKAQYFLPVKTRLGVETYGRFIELTRRRGVSQADLLREALERLLAEAAEAESDPPPR